MINIEKPETRGLPRIKGQVQRAMEVIASFYVKSEPVIDPLQSLYDHNWIGNPDVRPSEWIAKGVRVTPLGRGHKRPTDSKIG